MMMLYERDAPTALKQKSFSTVLSHVGKSEQKGGPAGGLKPWEVSSVPDQGAILRRKLLLYQSLL
jgi:hypothetical protein